MGVGGRAGPEPETGAGAGAGAEPRAGIGPPSRLPAPRRTNCRRGPGGSGTPSSKGGSGAGTAAPAAPLPASRPTTRRCDPGPRASPSASRGAHAGGTARRAEPPSGGCRSVPSVRERDGDDEAPGAARPASSAAGGGALGCRLGGAAGSAGCGPCGSPAVLRPSADRPGFAGRGPSALSPPVSLRGKRGGSLLVQRRCGRGSSVGWRTGGPSIVVALWRRCSRDVVRGGPAAPLPRRRRPRGSWRPGPLVSVPVRALMARRYEPRPHPR